MPHDPSMPSGGLPVLNMASTLVVAVASTRLATTSWTCAVRSAACFVPQPSEVASRARSPQPSHLGPAASAKVHLHSEGSRAGSMSTACAAVALAAGARSCRRQQPSPLRRRAADPATPAEPAMPAEPEATVVSPAEVAAALAPVEAAADGAPAVPMPGLAKPKLTVEEARLQLENAQTPTGEYTELSKEARSTVSKFFFPDQNELDMDKSMPLEDHIKELRDALLRTLVAVVVCVSLCLTFYKEIAQHLETPAQMGDSMVKFVQLAPGEFFFVSVKAAIAIGLLLAFPYALFEAALYFTPALTKSERNILGPVVLSSSALFYIGSFFAFSVLSPAALGFFLNYSQDVIESQFSIDQYFDFILSMCFACGIAFQVPVLQVVLGLFNVVKSDQLFSVWRYVIVGSAVVGAILTPSTDPITQLLLSGALCALYFAGAGALVAIGR
mmetsp:Transcript_79417/g.223060  ORF Transcript_79417/g.223060 Transcript_79417/m.223060 type:complete len:443 (-) Transcript_79417:217-1545(-)